MRTMLGISVGLMVGSVAGYFLGKYLAGQVLEGYACGLVGFFITGPFGAVGGGVAGGFLARRR